MHIDLATIKQFNEGNVVHNALELFIKHSPSSVAARKRIETVGSISASFRFLNHDVILILERRYEDEMGKYAYSIRSKNIQYNNFYGILMWLGCRDENLRFDYSAIHISNISKSEIDGITSGVFAISLATKLCDTLNARVSFLYDRSYVTKTHKQILTNPQKPKKKGGADTTDYTQTDYTQTDYTQADDIQMPPIITGNAQVDARAPLEITDDVIATRNTGLVKRSQKHIISLSLYKLMERDTTWYEKYGYSICFKCLSESESDVSDVERIYYKTLEALKKTQLSNIINELTNLKILVDTIITDRCARPQDELERLSMIHATCIQALAIFKQYKPTMTLRNFIIDVWDLQPREVEIISNLFIENPDYNTWNNMENKFHILYEGINHRLKFVDNINILGYSVNKVIRIRYRSGLKTTKRLLAIRK
jgi:hypothetical protein